MTMDDNDREDKPDETPAPPLSAEFMSGGTAAGLEKIRARLADGEEAFAAIAALLGCQAPLDTRSIDLLFNCLQAFDKAPLEVLHLRSPQLESEGVDRIVGAAAARARTLRDQHGRLDDTFNLSTVFETTDAPRLRAHASDIEDANVWQRLFGRDYRTARKTFNKFARDTRKASRQQMTQDFRSLAEYHQARTEFDSDKQCRELLGAHFKGVETKWDDLQLLVTWYQDVFTLLPEVDENSVAFRDLLLKSRTERLKAVSAGLAAHPKNRAAVEQLRTTISQLPTAPGANGPATRPIAELQTRLKAANSHLEEGIAALLMADLRPEVIVSSNPVRHPDPCRIQRLAYGRERAS
jgi:hypothetical protein